MNDGLLLLFMGSELFHYSQSFHLHAAEDLVKNLISQELYLAASFHFALVQVVQLSLALVELVQVRLF